MGIVFVPNLDPGYEVQVSRGAVSGAEPFGSYGRVTTTGAVTNQLIWPDGNFLVPPPAGLQLSIVSTSAQDGVGGTGIRSVHLHYLDSSYNVQSEIITLDGLTPVTTVATNIRFVQCMHINTYGTGKAAAGTITASNGGNNYSQIASGSVRCSSSARMVPAGKRLFVTSFSGGSSSGTAAASTIIRIAATVLDTHDYTNDSIFIPYSSAAVQDNNTTLTIPVPLVFNTGTVVGMIANTDKVATIVGSWFGWLENV